MPSRKRNKGKERKAKKEAAKSEAIWRGWALPSAARCNHVVVATIPPPEHAIYNFLRALNECAFQYAVFSATTFNMHPEVWNNVEHRQTAIGILLRMGADIFLNSGVDEDEYKEERGIAQTILLLDCYDGQSDFGSAACRAAVKGKVLFHGSGERDILKFYSKRLSCSCLTEKYKKARKTLPKLGVCLHCKQKKDRASLWVCGRCKVPFYCSRECQVANWPEHRDCCGHYIEAKNAHEAS